MYYIGYCISRGHFNFLCVSFPSMRRGARKGIFLGEGRVVLEKRKKRKEGKRRKKGKERGKRRKEKEEKKGEIALA